MTSYTWAKGDSYERYVGRWSRAVASEFVRWLAVPPDQDWTEVGCGTGALTSTILALAAPRRLRAYDLSAGFLATARQYVTDTRVVFEQSDATSLPEPDGVSHATVSGLMLNFVPEPLRAIAEMRRVTVPGGTVGVYVWDYAGEMQLMRIFWDAAVELDPRAGELDEGLRFPLCKPGPLRELFASAGLQAIQTRAIDVPTDFENFDDYWEPFLGGQGPAPGYVNSLETPRRAELESLLRERLPIQRDGSIHLVARAWAIRGEVPGAGT
jgi:SAM-dependent methyltransferase